jgi:ArsR family transcriptional regulator, virulence genes transcriptional regulator
MPDTARQLMPPASADAMGEHAEGAAALLKSMANPHRPLLLCVLGEGEFSVGALNERVALSQSALSQHLAVLRAEGLVETRREAQTIYYRVRPGPALDVIRVLHAHFCTPKRPRARRRPTTGASR